MSVSANNINNNIKNNNNNSNDHSDKLIFYVNGIKIIEEYPQPELTLIYYLRNVLQLTGTKLGCGEGGCGACTVMLSKLYNNGIEHYSVYACLTPLCKVHGMAVTTVEGIGSTQTKLHPIQERISLSHGSQCGFCTPGIVMSMYALIRNTSTPSLHQIEKAFEGNLCRCTGYRPILDGFKTFSCPQGELCCQNKQAQQPKEQSNEQIIDPNGLIRTKNGMFNLDQFQKLDPSQDLIFPPELLLPEVVNSNKLICFHGNGVTWYRPSNLTELLDLKYRHPGAKIVVGSTELRIETKFKSAQYPTYICPSQITEMNELRVTEDGVLIGASTSLSRVYTLFENIITTEPTYRTRILVELNTMLDKFAGAQIRNMACIGGNIITASPIADINPILLAIRTKLIVNSVRHKTKSVCIDDKFFCGYRKIILDPDEVIISVFIPFTKKNEYFKAYKQSKRRDDDISIVNAAFWITLADNHGTSLQSPQIADSLQSPIITELRLSYGGMSPITILATNTNNTLSSMRWGNEVYQKGVVLLMEELKLPPDVPGGMPDYRVALACSFFYKFCLYISHNLGVCLQDGQLSALCEIERPPIQSAQVYEQIDKDQLLHDMVGHPITHLSATKQATGEARYLDDIPLISGELHAAVVLSKRSHANILSIDTSNALVMPGVHAYISYTDIPAQGTNKIGIIGIIDEELFASSEVVYAGQLIGLVIADTPLIAWKAGKLVKVEYEDLPPVITIEEAIATNSYYDFYDHYLETGDATSVLSQCEHVISGEMRVGGQEHFYFETQASLIIPKGEDGEYELISSTQGLTLSQTLISRVLGIPSSKITCKAKRIGGGFGGKETRSGPISAAIAVASNKLNKPIRIVLERDDDMKLTGGRHPFLSKYKVGYTTNGKIEALSIDLYCNAGSSIDLSTGVVDRALFSVDNTYHIPNLICRGYICKTNLPSNTAYRGFGSPQAMIIIEDIISTIAMNLRMSPNEVRSSNFYTNGSLTHYGQEITDCQIQNCWDLLIERCEYTKLMREIEIFNKQNAYHKRGISCIPTKYSVAFGETSMNQGAALVHIHNADGSVLLSHGGIEMGQGLHTKMIQVCAKCLNIPMNYIHISETSTATVVNTHPTAASMSSDLYGMAILNACEKLNSRLAPFKKANPNGSWEDWVHAANADKVNLSAQGYFSTNNETFSWKTRKGKLYQYYTYGAGCSVVEIDTLTGEFQVLKTDIVMDVGKSINPAIDIGQIEGAFIQGMGLHTMEELVYLKESSQNQKGLLFSCGPGTYKIPSFGDIPRDFKVCLLHNVPNKNAVYSSKAIGEPPLFLGSTVFFAIKDAISAARVQSGVDANFHLESPATVERIRMACIDEITQQIQRNTVQTGKSDAWNVIV